MAWTMIPGQRIPVTVEFRGANLADGSPGPILPVEAGRLRDEPAWVVDLRGPACLVRPGSTGSSP
jgi:hypothetical protein